MARSTSGSSSTVNITGFGIALSDDSRLALVTFVRLSCARFSRYNFGLFMSSPLASAIRDLSSSDPVLRSSAAAEIYRRGRAPADRAVYTWWTDLEFARLFGSTPAVTVGLAVHRDTFDRIRLANGSPTLADVPPDQDAEEFEFPFANEAALDVLAT